MVTAYVAPVMLSFGFLVGIVFSIILSTLSHSRLYTKHTKVKRIKNEKKEVNCVVQQRVLCRLGFKWKYVKDNWSRHNRYEIIELTSHIEEAERYTENTARQVAKFNHIRSVFVKAEVDNSVETLWESQNNNKIKASINELVSLQKQLKEAEGDTEREKKIVEEMLSLHNI